MGIGVCSRVYIFPPPSVCVGKYATPKLHSCADADAQALRNVFPLSLCLPLSLALFLSLSPPFSLSVSPSLYSNIQLACRAAVH